MCVCTVLAGAWTIGAGQIAPSSSSAANRASTHTHSGKNVLGNKTHMQLGGFLEFLKFVDIVPRLTSSVVACGLYSCVSRDSAAAGLNGHIGSLGWEGFQQCVGMVAAFTGQTQVSGNDALHLISASGVKQFGIFPSEVARQECEEGAHAAFLEHFATQQMFDRFSSLDPSKTRGMTLDQATAVIHELRANQMFITPSVIAQEFRKVVPSTDFPMPTSPRAMVSAANGIRIGFEQFRSIMSAISLRIGPCVLMRTVCISLAAHAAGHTGQRDSVPKFDNGAPNAPHQANPKAFLRPTRPSTAPRGLRPAARPPSVIKTENFLKPTPPMWRPGGPVDSKQVLRSVPTLTPSTMLGSAKMKVKNTMEHEESDFIRLHEGELLASSSSRIKQSTSISLNSQLNAAKSSELSLLRLKHKARQDYARMLDMNDDISLHHSISSWIDRAQTKPDQQGYIDLEFTGGRIIRGGRSLRPQHLIPTAPPSKQRLRQDRGHKRMCPDAVYETAPVLLQSHQPSPRTTTPGRGETLLRQAHKMADKAGAQAIAAKKRMATRMGGVQPFYENGSWYMRSPSIYATSSPGAMTQPLAQVCVCVCVCVFVCARVLMYMHVYACMNVTHICIHGV